MVVLVGIHAFLTMQRTEDPSVTIRTGLVAAMYPGATSEQVEKQVTKTLEKHIFKFPEVRKEKTYSTSRPGVVIINVELEDNVKNSDVFWAKLRHELNVVKSTELPAGVSGTDIGSCRTLRTRSTMRCAPSARWGNSSPTEINRKKSRSPAAWKGFRSILPIRAR
jgi:multidrug efflux pump subunit AcrB